MAQCAHETFDASVRVDRLIDSGRFTADIKIVCRDCGSHMKFLGLPRGLNLDGACVSFDGTEARLAIAPKGEAVPPIKGVRGFTIRKPEDVVSEN